MKKKNNCLGLIKQVRKKLTLVKDENLSSDGYVKDSIKLSASGSVYIQKTTARHASPILQSRYESSVQQFMPAYENQFLPAYPLSQAVKKRKHSPEALAYLKNKTKYNKLSETEKFKFDLELVEMLLADSGTELYTNAMSKKREPIILVLNRADTGYPIKNHVAIFERRPELFKYNYYISNYIASDNQIKKFDLSKDTVIIYQDLMGNQKENIGPTFGLTND